MKVRENRLRRAAKRQGLHLCKSGRRDPRAIDYGRFWLLEPSSNIIIAGGKFELDIDDLEEFGMMDLDAVEAFLTSAHRRDGVGGDDA